MASMTTSFTWQTLLQISTLHHIPEEIFSVLDIKTLNLCRSVSKQWNNFIQNNFKLNKKQLQFGLKLAKRRDFYAENTFNAEQYLSIKKMVWNPNDLKIVLKVAKEICKIKSKDKNPICHALSQNNLDFIKAMAKTTFNFEMKHIMRHIYVYGIKEYNANFSLANEICIEKPYR